VSLATLFILAWKTWFHLTHYAVAGLPAFLALLGAGITTWRNRSLGKALSDVVMASLVGLNLVAIYNMHFDPRYAGADWRGVTRYIESGHREGDMILLVGRWTDMPLAYYQRRPMVWRHVPAADRPSVEAVGTEMQALLTQDIRRVWLVSSGQQPIVDPEHRVEGWFRGNARLVEQKTFPKLPVMLFDVPPREKANSP
jgi:hypothetical protein